MKGVKNQSNSTDDKIKSFLKWNRHTVKKKKSTLITITTPSYSKQNNISNIDQLRAN